MKYSQGHDVAVLHCKQQQHLHHTYSLYHTFLSLSNMQAKKQAQEPSDTHTHTHWVKTTSTDMQSKADKRPTLTLMAQGSFPTHITHSTFA